MTPERWQRVKDLFRLALEHKTEERSAFLSRACQGDDSLRREIDSLLASFDESDSLIETPLARAATQLLASDQFESLIGKKIGHYEIISLLGAGGMGAVYLARDIKLGRKVALKLLPAYFTGDPDRLRRFEQEACAASALNHPNIITIYEIGDTDETHFIATELIEGQTLRQRMTHAPMAIGEVLNVAGQVASALAAAHEAGIIHRDIKPENIMVRPDALVKVLDFGIAKLIRQAVTDMEGPTRALVQTSAGLVMGTLPYMSPEQALGRDVDHRSDLFSLGVLLYEMATGRSPFAGNSAMETLDRILHAQSEAIARSNADVPAKFEQVVQKCLEKDREQRYQTTRELAIDLENVRREWEANATGGIGAAQSVASGAVAKISRSVKPQSILTSWRARALMAVMLVIIAALGYWFFGRGAPAGKRPQIKSLAVLPLENLSGDPAQDYFADGMTEALISNLSQIHALSRVISRTSVMRYKGSQKSLPEIARELNVDAVIEGSVRRSGGRVLVTARLIPAAADSPMWQRDYNRDLSDVLKLESEVARSIADEIRIEVTAEESVRLASTRSINPAAHEAYLLGRYHSQKFNEEDLQRAIDYFERAIQLAPDYAAAYAELSEAWRARGVVGAKTFKEVEAPAREAVLKAIALDPNLADAHAHLGNLKYIYDKDWSGAEQEMKRAVALDPNSLFPHLAYAYLLMALGRFPEALTHQQIATQLDPTTSFIRSDVGRILYFAGKYEEAITHINRALELDPRNDFAFSYLADVYAQLGRYAEALAALDKAEAIRPHHWTNQARRAVLYARIDRRRETLRMIDGFKVAGRPSRFPEVGLAQVYAALNDKDETFRLLLRAIENRDQFSSFIKIDHAFDSLHSDARWNELLRRMNYPIE